MKEKTEGNIKQWNMFNRLLRMWDVILIHSQKGWFKIHMLEDQIKQRTNYKHTLLYMTVRSCDSEIYVNM